MPSRSATAAVISSWRRPHRVVIALMVGLSMFAPAIASGAEDGDQVWKGQISYFDDTVDYEQLEDSVEVTRVAGSSTFVMSASITYTTGNNFCTFTWFKTFTGTGTLDATRNEIAFDGSKTVQNVSTCADANTQNAELSARVLATIDGEQMTGIVVDGEFVIEGFTLDNPGVIERDGNLYLVTPPNGVLSIGREDLPEWAREQIAVVGAMIAVTGAPDSVLSGDPTVLIDGMAVARLGDPTAHGGSIVEASNRIFANGVPVAVIGSFAVDPMSTMEILHVGGPIVTNRGLPPLEDIEPWTETQQAQADVFGELLSMYRRKLWKIEKLLDWRRLESMKLEVRSERFDVGDAIIITAPDGTSEAARVVGKGSLILDRLLENEYPPGSWVLGIPPEIAAQIPDLDEGAVSGASSDGESSQQATGLIEPEDGSPIVPIVLGVVALGAIAGGVLVWRRKATQ